MPKNSRVRTLKESQRVKGPETVIKSAQPYFGHLFWSLWKVISSENSVLVLSEILRLFVNILTPNEMYCLSVKKSV